MKSAPISITRWVSDDQPGFIAFELTDRHGKIWHFVEKTAIPWFEGDLDAQSSYPRTGAIAGEIVARGRDGSGRATVSIDTERPWGVCSVDDVSTFELFEDQIIDGLPW